MVILAFDTATDVATSALVADGEVVGERASRAVTLLEDVDALLRQAGARAGDIEALAVGTGPGSFTGVRIGLWRLTHRTGAAMSATEAVGLSTFEYHVLLARASGPLHGYAIKDAVARIDPGTRENSAALCVTDVTPLATATVLPQLSIYLEAVSTRSLCPMD